MASRAIVVADAPPMAVDDSATTFVDTAVTIGVLVNDSELNGDPLLLAGVGTPSDGIAAISGDTVVYTPALGFVGTDAFTYTASDGSLTDVATVTVLVGRHYVYLPLVLRNYVVAPDLVVQDVIATSYDVQVVIENQGNGPATEEFWVDAYIDPYPAPTQVNQTWNDLADEGLVWGVTTDMQPGDRITLTVGDAYYVADYSQVAWPLTAGTPVYAQVDSWSADTTYGAVLESHEITAGAYDNNIGSTVATLGGEGTVQPRLKHMGSLWGFGRLPRRP
jgi:hypothetical protein